MFVRSRRVGAALLPLLLLASARADVETVDITRRRRAGFGPAAGVSGAFFGEVDGQRYLFKTNAPIRSMFGLKRESLTGNVESEWLSHRLMRQAGVASPEVDVVQRPGRRHSLARVQHMADMFPGQELVRGADALKAGDRIDLAAVHRMQAVDLLIGNPDRHALNMWFVKDPASGLLRPIAFDHNIALGTRQSFTGTRGHTNWSAFEQTVVRTLPDGTPVPGGMAAESMGRNPLYADAILHPGELRSLHRQAGLVAASIGEERIRTLVAEIPASAIGSGDKAARRAELEAHLLRRRRELVPAIEAYMRQHPAYLQSQWELGRLAPELRAKLPRDMAGRWAFVEALGPDGKFDRERLGRALGGAGITGTAAEGIQGQLARQGAVGGGGAGPTGDGRPRTYGDVVAKKPSYRGTMPSHEGLEYTSGKDGGRYRTLDGTPFGLDSSAVSTERRRTVQVAQAVASGASLQDGDRVRVRKRPGFLGGFEAEVVTPKGDVVETGRYHAVGNTTVGTSRGVRGRAEALTGVSQARVRPTRRRLPGGVGFTFRPRIRIHRRGR